MTTPHTPHPSSNPNISCKIIRSKRKTLALQVHRDGSVVVRAPLSTMNHEISHFVEKMKKWIEKQQRYFKELPRQQQRMLAHGATYPLLGTQYPIKIANEAAKPEMKFKDHTWHITCSTEQEGKKLLEAWYKKRARVVFKDRLDHIAKTHNMPYRSLKLSSARTRWGSCSRNKNINLTWRLIMAPLEIIDYVIVHELSHTIHMDHSKKFWNHVQSIMPNHLKYKDWLKDHGRSLHI